MKKILFITLLILGSIAVVYPQRTTFRGTVLIYGSGLNTRTVTAPFTLTINSETSPSEAQRLLSVLQENGQEALLNAIRRTSGVGRFSIGSRVGHELGAVVVDNAGGKRRIRAILDRWIGFGELWRSSRSTDYPFSYIELLVDPRTGRGEGTFIQAAKIRWRNNKGQNEVEIEDFGTFPGRLLGVTMRGGRVP